MTSIECIGAFDLIKKLVHLNALLIKVVHPNVLLNPTRKTCTIN